MKYFLIIILAFLAFNSTLSAQEDPSILIDNDKEKFEQNVFNKEFGEEEFEDVDSVELQRKLYDKTIFQWNTRLSFMFSRLNYCIVRNNFEYLVQ